MRVTADFLLPVPAQSRVKMGGGGGILGVNRGKKFGCKYAYGFNLFLVFWQRCFSKTEEIFHRHSGHLTTLVCECTVRFMAIFEMAWQYVATFRQAGLRQRRR